MFSVYELSDDLLIHVANGNPAVPDWPNICDDDSPAPYLKFIQAIESLEGLSVGDRDRLLAGTALEFLGLEREQFEAPSDR